MRYCAICSVFLFQDPFDSSFYLLIMELLGNVKNYEWGKVGPVSKVAQLAKLNCDEFAVEP